MIPQTQLQSHQPKIVVSNFHFRQKQQQSHLPQRIFNQIRRLCRSFDEKKTFYPYFFTNCKFTEASHSNSSQP